MKKEWREIRTIVMKANSKCNEGDIESALTLLDDAIHLAEERGLSVVDLRIRRESLTPKNIQDFSKVINFIQRATEDYKQQGNILNQIQMLIQLAHVRFRYLNEVSEALLTLDEAEHIITSITSKEITSIINKYPRFDAAFVKQLLSTRQKELTNLRKTIEMGKGNQDKSYGEAN